MSDEVSQSYEECTKDEGGAKAHNQVARYTKPQNNGKPGSSAMSGIYRRGTLTAKVPLNISEIGDNPKSILEQHIVHQIKNKCQPDGWMRYTSVEIISYSGGLVKGVTQVFQVVYECLICNPNVDMIIEGVECKSVSIAGIKGEYYDGECRAVPLVIYLAKDYHYNNLEFDKIKPGDVFACKVLASRYELNDAQITVMAILHIPYVNKK